MYVYGLPVCHECAKAIIQVGIKRVVIPFDHINDLPDRWRDSTKLTMRMFDEAGVEYHPI